MRILVTTPTGNIGSRIVARLLDTPHAVTVLARTPSKLTEATRERATVVTGSLDDAGALAEALRGIDVAFFLIPPPGPTVTHWRNWQAALGRQFAAAAAAAEVNRVVFLSSVGAQHDDVSAISGLGEVERTLRGAIPNVLALRAGYFMENSFGSLPTIAGQGAVYGVVDADVPQQLVATRDIGDAAVRWLTDSSWSGHRSVGVHGPAAVSANAQAAILSDVFGRNVAYVQISPPDLRNALLQAGLPELIANGYEEMMGGMAKHLRAGDFSAEPPTPETSGVVTYAEFARTTMLPAYEAQFAAQR